MYNHWGLCLACSEFFITDSHQNFLHVTASAGITWFQFLRHNDAIKHDISEFSYVSFEATLPVWCRWLDIGNRQAHTSNNSGVFVFLKKGALVARVWSSWADIRNTHHTHTGTSFAPFFSLRRKKSNVWFVRSCDHLIALKQEIQLWAGRSLNWSICSDLTPMSHPYTIAPPPPEPEASDKLSARPP